MTGQKCSGSDNDSLYETKDISTALSSSRFMESQPDLSPPSPSSAPSILSSSATVAWIDGVLGRVLLVRDQDFSLVIATVNVGKGGMLHRKRRGRGSSLVVSARAGVGRRTLEYLHLPIRKAALPTPSLVPHPLQCWAIQLVVRAVAKRNAVCNAQVSIPLKLIIIWYVHAGKLSLAASHISPLCECQPICPGVGSLPGLDVKINVRECLLGVISTWPEVVRGIGT